MNPSNNIDITELLAEKSFEELSETERNFALSELGSADEYEQMRAIISGTQSLDDVEPDAMVKENLMSAFDKAQRDVVPVIPIKRGKKKRLIIALAAAATIAVICTISISYLSTETNSLAENKLPIEKNKKDTSIVKRPTKALEKPKSLESKPVDEIQNNDENQPIEKTETPPTPVLEEIEIADEVFLVENTITEYEIEESLDEDHQADMAAPQIMLDQYAQSEKNSAKESKKESDGYQESEMEEPTLAGVALRGSRKIYVDSLNNDAVLVAENRSATTKTTNMSAIDVSAITVKEFDLFNLKITLPDSNHYTSY